MSPLRPWSLLDSVVMFICNHCPFVVHVLDELIRIGNDYRKRGIGFVAISSNDVTTHPDDSPGRMKELAVRKHFPFPYLYDESLISCPWRLWGLLGKILGSGRPSTSL